MTNRAAVDEATPRAAVYARISEARGRNGAATDVLGVKRQEKACRELAAARGYEVVASFTDNDVSAYSGKRRPQFEAMLDAVRDGAISVVISWANDRLYRRALDQLTVLQVVKDAGGVIVTVKDGETDPSSAEGAMRMGILANVAEFESARKAERAIAKHAELAEDGKPGGGGVRPFGFESDQVTVRESEARHIREAVARILDGDTLRAVHADWTERGILTPRGGVWAKVSLRRMLRSPRIAGLREHNGAVIGDAIWSPIITREQHEAICAVFDSNPRSGIAPVRSYLLTGGLARCGQCGAAMVAKPKERRRYACSKDHGGCGKTYLMADTLEDFVRDAVFAALDDAALMKARTAAVAANDDEDVIAELDVIEARRAEATEAYGSGALTLAGFQAIDRDLAERHDAIRDRLAAKVGAGFVRDLPPNAAALQEVWDAADIERRQRLVALVLDAVEIGPAVRGRNRFDPERVTLRWKV